MNISNTNNSLSHCGEEPTSSLPIYQLYFIYRKDTGDVFYVGVTQKTLVQRLGNHIAVAKAKNRKGEWYNETHQSRKLRKLMSDQVEFGIENLLSFSVREEAYLAEIKYIDWCRSVGIHLTNISLGGKGGVPLSDETKEKLREANLGPNNPMYGHVPSKESNERQSQVMKGRVPLHWQDPDKKLIVREKISRAKEGQQVGENNPNYGNRGAKNRLSQKVCQYDLNGNLLQVFGGLREAARAIERDTKGIRRCLKGERTTCAGFIWKYPTSSDDRLRS